MTGFYEGTGGVQEPIPHTLDTHTDVTIIGVEDKDVLAYDADSGQWINSTVTVPDITLATLPDTDIPDPLDQQVLTFNGASNLWVAGTISPTGDPISINDLTDVTITDATNGDRLVYDGGQWVNVDSSQSVANPITVGNGADNSDAGVILNSGTVEVEDTAYIQFQRNAVDNYKISSFDYLGANALVVDSALPDSGIVLKSKGPANEDYSLNVGTNGDLQWSGDSVIINDLNVGTGNADLIFNQGTAQADHSSIYVKENGVNQWSLKFGYDNGVAKDAMTLTHVPSGVFWAFAQNGELDIFGSINTFASIHAGGGISSDANMTATNYIINNTGTPQASWAVRKSYADATYVALNGDQSIGGTKTFTATNTVVQNINVQQNIACASFNILGRHLQVGAFGVIVMAPSAFTTEQSSLVRTAFLAVADILNATPTQTAQIETVLSSIGIS